MIYSDSLMEGPAPSDAQEGDEWHYGYVRFTMINGEWVREGAAIPALDFLFTGGNP